MAKFAPRQLIPYIAQLVCGVLGVGHRQRVFEEERMPGDGYLGYVKPFRTIEDVHVLGATLGYVLGWVRRVRAAEELLPEISAHLLALDGLLTLDALDPRAHVALHGVYERVGGLLEGEGFAGLLTTADEGERERWSRDRALLQIAQKARRARFARALEDLG